MFLDFQLDYLLWLQNLRDITSNIFTPFFLVITNFGEKHIPILFVAFVYWSINKRAGEFVLINLFFGYTLNQFFKMLFCINRPWILSDKIKPVEDAIPAASGYSFPSGHTAGAMAIWGGFAVQLWEKKFVRYFLFILIFLIAFSRNYLGVHTLQDVLVSFILGIIVLIITKKIFDNINDKNTDFRVFLSGICLLALTVITAMLKPSHDNLISMIQSYDSNWVSFCFNVGYLLGIITGWYACRKLIPFDTTGITWTKRIVRYLLGAGILIPFMTFAKNILENDFGKFGGGFLYAFIISIFVTFFYPWMFTRVERYIEEKRKNTEID